MAPFLLACNGIRLTNKLFFLHPQGVVQILGYVFKIMHSLVFPIQEALPLMIKIGIPFIHLVGSHKHMHMRQIGLFISIMEFEVH